MKPLGAAVLGCGDFLRTQEASLKASRRLKVRSLFDPRPGRAEAFAGRLGAAAVGSVDDCLKDPAIEVLLIFVPPWARKELVLRAAQAGKPVITTKPLAASLGEATEMLRACRGRIPCSVLYKRSGDAGVETLKSILESGEVGRLGLYKQDWLHHYPTWNDWATDPSRNGGPFMDAMIHNLNISRYLAGRPARSLTFSSESHAQKLACSDTESLKLDFEGGASAYLWITWAGDYAVGDPTRNDREHHDHLRIITDQGWVLEMDTSVRPHVIRGRKNELRREWPLLTLPGTPYDDFAEALNRGVPVPWSLEDAWWDIWILDQARTHVGSPIQLKPKLPE